MLGNLRPFVFWPSVIALLLALILSIVQADLFLSIARGINSFILKNFSFLFSGSTILLLICSVLLLLSPVGKIRIGGKDAKPVLSRWRWFSIILCTTVATGILFWGMAEPIFHYTSPPESLGIKPSSHDSMVFSMSSMYLHWSFTPYAIYVVPAVLFALAFFNYNKDYSISATLFSLGSRAGSNKVKSTIDTIALFALVSGMAASLGTGILTLAGGLNQLFGIESSFLLLLAICIAIVAIFLISAISGLLKGIRILSVWNVRVFFLILGLFLVFGPIGKSLILNTEGLLQYATQFISKSTFTGQLNGDDWPQKWTMFNWANWMAWAPVTALFLGNLGYGRTVREFMLFTWLLPSIFSIIWMSVFSGNALVYQFSGTLDLASALEQNGPESIVYLVMQSFPGGFVISILFFIAVFVSFVTAADSTTVAMGALSVKGLSPENPDPPKRIKIIWGILVGAVAFIMVGFAGIDGVKMISVIGGFPIVFLMILMCFAVFKLVIKYDKNNIDL